MFNFPPPKVKIHIERFQIMLFRLHLNMISKMTYHFRNSQERGFLFGVLNDPIIPCYTGPHARQNIIHVIFIQKAEPDFSFMFGSRHKRSIPAIKQDSPSPTNQNHGIPAAAPITAKTGPPRK
jgi:hypothetical protein